MASFHNLVFLHGWGTDPLVWKYQLEYFSGRYKVELPHLSELTAKDWQPGTALIGWSHGGMSALRIASSPNNIIEVLVLVASTAKFADPKNGTHPSVLKKIKKGLECDFAKTIRDCYRTFFSETETTAATQFINEQRLPDKSTAISVLDDLAVSDLKGILEKINIPTLIVHGEKDAVCPLAAGEFLQANIKGSSLCVIKGAGHMPFYTRPEEFNDILEGFLSGVK